MIDIGEIAEALASVYGKHAKRTATGYMTHCRCHDDKNGSLSLASKEGKVLAKCHAGCSQTAVFEAIKPLIPEYTPKNGNGSGKTISAVYPYRDADGKLIFEKVRYIPKGFVIRRPNGSGDYVWDLKGVDKSLLYRLPEVLEAIKSGDAVYIAEGEKDADNLASLGLTATCNVFGASEDAKKPKWTSANAKWLAGAKEVVIFPDYDAAGMTHAQGIASSLQALRISCKIVQLPGLSPKEDISDWLRKGGDKSKLLELVSATVNWNIDSVRTDHSEEHAEPEAETKPKIDITAHVIELARDHFELWHNQQNEACATLKTGDVSMHYFVNSLAFHEQLRGIYFDKHEQSISPEPFRRAVETLAMLAKRRGEKYESALRVAHSDGLIYLFLANEVQEIVLVDTSGWKVISGRDCPIRFVKTTTTAPLPVPASGGNLDALFDFISIDESDRAARGLIKLWLLACLAPTESYPVLRLKGKEGSGKSLATSFLQSLIDPQLVKSRSLPGSEQDLMVAAQSSFLLPFDNVSELSPEQSDSLCRISTGGTFGTRELFTNKNESLITAKAPVILNGITDFVVRGDLNSRTLTVGLSCRKRKPAKKLASEFEEQRAALLGAMLDIVVAGLKRLPEIDDDNLDLPRLADVAVWLIACEDAIGLTSGAALSLINENQRQELLAASAEHPVVLAVEKLLQDEMSWHGTASELLGKLVFANEKSKPANAVTLRKELNRNETCLGELGIDIDFCRKGKHGRKLIFLTKSKFTDSSAPSDSASQAEPFQTRLIEGVSDSDSPEKQVGTATVGRVARVDDFSIPTEGDNDEREVLVL
jgi:5S rRNA maturation endonuclease (ribonuclease M5)